MPKRRSVTAFRPAPGGGSGGGGGGGAVAAAGAAARASPQSFVPSTYEVEVHSAARGRTEPTRVTFVSPSEAEVASASGAVYRVEVGEGGRMTCTCPDYRFRRSRTGGECRHIGAYRSALAGRRMVEEAAPRAAVLPSGRRAFDASRAAGEAAERRREAAAAAEAARPPAREHEVSLADEAAFRELLERAARGDLPYEYENVLDGSDNTFGVEIEFEGGDREAIARELYERGYIPEPRQVRYHAPRRPGMWSFETDASVASGGELVSPVFRDTPEAWRQIEEICEIVRRHGGRATARCGAHVHIGNLPLDHDPALWERLAALNRAYEDVIYRMAAGGESGGRHRGTRYAVPLSRISGGPQQAGHYGAVNARPHTVEFRYFNGTLDPRQIQANVRIAHAMVRAAADPSVGIPAEQRALGTTRGNRGEARHSTVRRFLDTIFTRARDKLSALWLYATSRWQPATT
ncbi:amidoligase family protein [Desulfovirgula thermocuniculi]|uniref:amidoligase family protein n=1 Tax=Desulfovirgula thermocuniculi TaxID=348842 RepID=UPI00068646BF|nr:amidoligase family protein [Desulfovirgula thermocuniculi]